MATKDRTALKDEFKNGNLATGERFADLIDSVKPVQEPVSDPAASGTSLSFIDSISQDEDGKITATKKTLDLANAHELNPFKGWYETGDTLPTDGFDGAYLYFKDTSELTGQTTIYRWNGTTYADTGTVVDTSNVQTFETGQSVNGTGIKDINGNNDPNAAGVLSAKAGKELNEKLYGVTGAEVVDSTDYASVFSDSTYSQTASLSAPYWTAGQTVYVGTGGGNQRVNILSGDTFKTIKNNFNHLRVTGRTSGYACYFMFLKKVPGAVNLTFEQMVAGEYVCDGYDTSSAVNVIFEVVANAVVTKKIPKDAEAVMISRKSVVNSMTRDRNPSSVVFVNIPHANGDIDDLKEQCAGVEDLAVAVDKVEVKTEDIEYSETPMAYTSADGYVNGNTGAVESSETVKVVTVGVGSAKKIKFLGYQLATYPSLPGYCFVDGDDVVLLSSKYVVNLDTETNGETKEYVVTVPEGAVALKCTVRAANMEDFYAKDVAGNTIGEAIAEAVKPVVSVVEEMEKVYETSFTYGTDTLAYGILKEDNSVLSNDSVRHLDTPIAVQPGDVVQAYAYYLDNGNEVKASSPNIQSVCCFKGGVNVRYGYRTITPQNVGSATRVEYYTVPEGVDSIKLSLAAVGNIYQRRIIVWRGATAKYVKVSNNDNYDQRLTVDAMEAEVEYALPYADVWSNRVIAFSALVTRDTENGIGTLTIGNKTFGAAVSIFGASATSIAITDTEITITGGVNGSETFTHGLTIDNDIQFIAETDRSYTQLVKVVLRSNGEEYSVTNFSKKFGQVGGERFISASVGGVFSSVSFCNTLKDLLAPVWVFGDSYLSNNGSSRWVYWAEENNVKNFMISSFAGAKSEDQIKSFRDLIAIHRPKVLCWFLGMNDPDSTGSTQSGTPKSSWLRCVNEVIETCDNYGVVVVLATIPSVKESGATAVWSNKAKNDWVKASGRRYFDEDAAVGATEDGVWISGYKESDGVHPSTKGAKALFTRLLADVPEIMFKG